MTREIDVPLDGDNLLSEAFRYAFREIAAEHSPEHPEPVEGCEGCEIVKVAATLRPEGEA